MTRGFATAMNSLFFRPSAVDEMISITSEPIDLARLTADFRSQASDAGAIVSFSGIVRRDGDVKALFLDHKPGLTENEIRKIVGDAVARWGLTAAAVVHRVGEIAAGEVVVFVATAAAHRRSAFQSCDFLMDYLKTDAPFWKKEITAAGSRWIEPREQDFADRRRWD